MSTKVDKITNQLTALAHKAFRDTRNSGKSTQNMSLGASEVSGNSALNGASVPTGSDGSNNGFKTLTSGISAGSKAIAALMA